MPKPSIIISGKNGQLANELLTASMRFPQLDYHFFGKEELDISDMQALEIVFREYKPAYFINAAAYTAVDKAEIEQEKAYLVNAVAVRNIAQHCRDYNTTLIHLSTDYVFDGMGTQPYKESDDTNPVNYYGFSKWMGEQFASQHNPKTIIIRTSWVYSEHGNNFVKTMLRLMRERSAINVVSDQVGSPTYAADIAETILSIILAGEMHNNKHAGIYHYSNDGAISWFEFATAIRDLKKLNCIVNPIPTTDYPTPARRPLYSVMNKEKIQSTFQIALKPWKESLEECLSKL
jgi:dTDP-4-dehydrorhamnose reductase